MDVHDNNLARAIRGLTLAIWCWLGLQVAMYGYSMFNISRDFGASQETTSREVLHSPQMDPTEGYDADFTARPTHDKVRLASAILVVEMKKVDGVHQAIVQEVLKLKPGTRLYYKVGDNFDDLNHMPDEACDSCESSSHQLVFMQGNPAQMRFSTTFDGDRVASLGGMSLDDLRALAREAPAAVPAK
jgi:hypothetical protein